jgi:hypothetical protein
MSSTAVMSNQSSAALIKSTFWQTGNVNRLNDCCIDSAGNVYTLYECREIQTDNSFWKYSLQKTKSDGTVAWTKILYQGTQSNQIQNSYVFIKAIDNDYLIFGGSSSADASSKGYISKINSSDGSVALARNFTNTDGRGYGFRGCHIDSSKAIYLTRYDLYGSPIIYKLDYNCNLIWAKSLPVGFFDSDGASNEYIPIGFFGNSLGQTVWCGNFYGYLARNGSPGNKYWKQSTMLFSLDSNGNLVYLKFVKPMQFYSGFLDESGVSYYTGLMGYNYYSNDSTTSSYNTLNNRYKGFLKLDAAGNVSFYKTSISNDTSAQNTYDVSLINDKQGNIYRISITPDGYAKPYLWINKFDSSGNLIWGNYLKFSTTWPNTTGVGIWDNNDGGTTTKSGLTPCWIENNKLIIPLTVYATAATTDTSRKWMIHVKLPTDGSKLGSYIPATYLTMDYLAQDVSNKTWDYYANSSPVMSANTPGLVTLSDTISASPTTYTVADTTISITNYKVPF